MPNQLFVSNAGNDSNPGTSGSPLLTIAQLANVYGSGDTLFLKGGDVFLISPTIFPSGCRVQSYGVGRATVNTGSGLGLRFVNASNVTVTNINFVGTGIPSVSFLPSVAFTNLVSGVPMTNLIVSGCTFNGPQCGIFGSCVAGAYQTNISITNNIFASGLFFGPSMGGSIDISNSNVLIERNEIFAISGTSTTGSQGAGHGIVIAKSDNRLGPCLIQYNHIHHCGATAIAGGADGIWTTVCSGVIIQYNVVHDLLSNGGIADAGAYDIDSSSSHCIIQYNYSYNNEGAGLETFSDAIGQGNVIRYNISVNDATVKNGSLYMSGQNDGQGSYHIYNNTCITSNGVSMGYIFPPHNKDVWNNIFINVRGNNLISNPSIYTNCNQDYNLYHGGGTFIGQYNNITRNSFPAYTGASGKDLNSAVTTQMPLLEPYPAQIVLPGNVQKCVAYSPLKGSAATVSGVDIAATFGLDIGTQDFLGNPIVNKTCMGAINIPVNPTSYQAAIFSDNPLVWFRFSDNSGAYLHDTMSVASAGSYVTGILLQSAIRPASATKCLGLNGLGGAYLPQTCFQGNWVSTQMSVEFWASVSTTNTSQIIESSNPTGAIFDFSFNTGLQNGVTEVVGLFKDALGAVQFATSGSNISLGVPFHYAVSWSGGNTVINYINGNSVPVHYLQTGVPGSSTFSKVTIGFHNLSTHSNVYVGTLSDLIFYQHPLTQSQVKSHYAAGLQVAGASNFLGGI